MDKKIPLIVLTGPTASGKTALSIGLAKRFGGEIVSADSMQIYKGMDIATAKPSLEQMKEIPHHLISVIERDAVFSVADYVKLASQAAFDIHSRGKLPFLVGGTGLYINSLVDNIQFCEEKSDGELRKRLYDEYDERGAGHMYERLMKIDPEYAASLHPNNKTRVLRALEIFYQTGVTMSRHLENSRLVESPYRVCMIGLFFKDRQRLYDRINLRVDQMLEDGLIEEARRVLAEDGVKTAGQAIGIKELANYFSGDVTLDEAVKKIKTESRRYAKRQLTWFRRDERIIPIIRDAQTADAEIYEQAEKAIEKFLVM